MKQRLVLTFFWFTIALFNIAVMFWMAASIMFSVKRATAIAIAYDRLGSAAMGNGQETISSWAGKKNSWQEQFINWLFKTLTGEENHCDNNRE